MEKLRELGGYHLWSQTLGIYPIPSRKSNFVAWSQRFRTNSKICFLMSLDNCCFNISLKFISTFPDKFCNLGEGYNILGKVLHTRLIL